MLAAQMAKPALDTVADHRVAHGTPHDETDPRRTGPVESEQMDHEGVTAGTTAGADHVPEVATTGEPMRRGKHGRCSRAGGRAGAQTARLLRPLRRRDDKMARPARVRMRSRNPCTLWRRRLFGWYVRLLTSSLRWCSGAVTPAVSQITRWSDGAGAKPRGFGRHRPPTRGSGPQGQNWSVDMRHPSTPGDRGTVRAASPRRQIATQRRRPTRAPVENWLTLPPRPGAENLPSACG